MKKRLGGNYRSGDAYFAFSTPSKDHFCESVTITVGMWHTVCLTTENLSTKLKVFVDNTLVANVEDYNQEHKFGKGNIFLFGMLGDQDDGSAEFEISDFNIWKEPKSKDFIEKWTNCDIASEGNFIKWSSNLFQLSNVYNREIPKDEICLQSKTKIVGSTKKRNIDDTIKWCKTLGGEIAVATDKQKLDHMINVMNDLNDEGCWSDEEDGFFTGYSDRKTEGEWLDLVKNEKMKFEFWADDEPDNDQKVDQDCAIYVFKEGKFRDRWCSQLACPLCELPWPATYQLNGIDFATNSKIDTHYVMKNESMYQGYIQSDLIKVDGKWIIREQVHSEMKIGLGKILN